MSGLLDYPDGLGKWVALSVKGSGLEMKLRARRVKATETNEYLVYRSLR